MSTPEKVGGKTQLGRPLHFKKVGGIGPVRPRMYALAPGRPTYEGDDVTIILYVTCADWRSCTWEETA